MQAAGGGADSLFIRGFYYDSGDYCPERPYGIAPYYSTRRKFHRAGRSSERPSAVLNGMTIGGTGATSGGAVGGSVNLVTKHAPDLDITQSDRNLYHQSRSSASISTSAGATASTRNGASGSMAATEMAIRPWNRQTDEFGNAVLGLDYRGENARFEADIGYQAENLNPPLRFYSRPALLPFLPPPPKPGTNLQCRGPTTSRQTSSRLTRGEVDLTDWVTAYGGVRLS